MAVDPYIVIDAAYSQAVNTALTTHQQAVQPLNTQLAADLAAAGDEAERAAVLEAFDAQAAPHRATYAAAVASAETTRQSARTAVAVERAAFEASVAAREANAATLRGKASTALTANSTFLAVASPTNAQTLAQVKALTRQTNGIIRLLLDALEDVSDT